MLATLEPPAQVMADYEPVPVQMLFAVESHADDSVGWVLECRSDEHGYGTPLLWYHAADAEAWIREGAEESGCYGDQRVVGFTLTLREDAPVRCDCCGLWGHAEKACSPDSSPGHTCVNGSTS